MIDWNKPIQTADGRPARLIGILAGHKRSHIVVLPMKSKAPGAPFKEAAFDYFPTGMFTEAEWGERHFNLINTPEPKPERWVNVYWDEKNERLNRGIRWGSEISAKRAHEPITNLNKLESSLGAYLATLKLPY